MLSGLVALVLYSESGETLSIKDCYLKFFLILHNVSGHPDPHEFNNGKVSGLPALKTTSLIQPLEQGVIWIFKAHSTWYSMERNVGNMEENLDREGIRTDWKDYTTEDAIIVKDKAMKAIKLKIINSCRSKLLSRCT